MEVAHRQQQWQQHRLHGVGISTAARDHNHGKGSRHRSQQGCSHRGDLGSCRQAGWLFVRNLPSAVGMDGLKYVFANYGKVRRIHVMNARSDDLRACAFVKYLFTCEARLAVQMLHGTYEMEPGLGPITLEADVPGVFVENLPGDVGEEMLSYVFSFYGKVRGIHMAASQSRHGCARAFIQYNSASAVETATLALRQMNFDGGRSVVPALTQEQHSEAEGLSEHVQEVADGNTKEMACVICMSSSKTHAFVPCGHRCVCADCGHAVVEQSLPTCPICRSEVERVLQIFC